MERIKIENHTFTGSLWFIGWLFTIGFLHLSFGKGLLAIIIWPYYMGDMISTFVR
ncbi:MAG: hypothetical protein IT410_00075 [Candidatus Doudnabacteria bacterium]|nr:hypothetical protein [Candidatus Doudnabacteria bacterium]